MDNINWSLAGSSSGSGYNVGAHGDVKDNNEGTGCGCSTIPVASPDPFDYTVEVAFAENALIIDTAEIYHSTSGAYNNWHGHWYVSLYYSGGWNQVMTGEWTGTSSTQTDNISTGWENVTKIKVQGTGYGIPDGMYPGACIHTTYELRAWGPPNFGDSGFRIKSSGGTVIIAGQRLNATHKLRLRTDGETLGIPLVATNDPDANGIRIFDGSDVKSLRNPD